MPSAKASATASAMPFVVPPTPSPAPPPAPWLLLTGRGAVAGRGGAARARVRDEEGRPWLGSEHHVWRGVATPLPTLGVALRLLAESSDQARNAPPSERKPDRSWSSASWRWLPWGAPAPPRTPNPVPRPRTKLPCPAPAPPARAARDSLSSCSRDMRLSAASSLDGGSGGVRKEE